MKTTLKKLNLTKKDIFNAPIIEQSHFGDYLKKIISLDEEGHEQIRIWQAHPENISQGAAIIEIEYFGALNGYTWETVKKYF